MLFFQKSMTWNEWRMKNEEFRMKFLSGKNQINRYNSEQKDST